MENGDHNSILILPNNIYSLLAAQAYAGELTKKAGFDLTDGARVCLALEEAILNVVAHSFEPSVTAMYQIVFRITSSTFTIILRDHGLPFEEEAVLPQDMTGYDLDDYPASGLGLHIMRNSVDHVFVKNCPTGKELHLIKYLSDLAANGKRGEYESRERPH